jgi:predicted DsbA family dithiol-disulfide isomerase
LRDGDGFRATDDLWDDAVVTTAVMYVDVWSDVVCPFCYLGTRQLDLALANFAWRDAVVVRTRAFELDPRAPSDSSLSLDQMLSAKYGVTVEKAAEMNRRVSAQAETLGMTWRLDLARPTNTFLAHQLTALALEQGRDDSVKRRLFSAYFERGENLNDLTTLTAIAEECEVAIPPDFFVNQPLADVVRHDERAAAELGISGVPALVVDEKFMIMGAQGDAQMLSVLERAWLRRSA